MWIFAWNGFVIFTTLVLRTLGLTIMIIETYLLWYTSYCYIWKRKNGGLAKLEYYPKMLVLIVGLELNMEKVPYSIWGTDDTSFMVWIVHLDRWIFMNKGDELTFHGCNPKVGVNHVHWYHYVYPCCVLCYVIYLVILLICDNIIN